MAAPGPLSSNGAALTLAERRTTLQQQLLALDQQIHLLEEQLQRSRASQHRIAGALGLLEELLKQTDAANAR